MIRRRGYRCQLLLLLLGFVTFAGCKETPVLKDQIVESLVHQELDLSASTYFDPVGQKDSVRIASGHLDVQTLGMYPLTLEYEGKSYAIQVKVVDHEKPVVRWKQTMLVFPLDVKLEDVNASIRRMLSVTDNYDLYFATAKALPSLPQKETSIQYCVTAKDSSGNVSKESILYVQFTKDGTKKTGGKEECIVEEIKAVPVPQKETKVMQRKKDDTTQMEERSTQNEAKTKEPIYPSKQELPILTVDNYPKYLLGNSDRVFASYEEAYAWAQEQVNMEGGPWYGYYVEIGQPYDGDYANAGETTAPWTVQFFQ